MSAIRTPDQRLRIFVSSTLQEVADERRAARKAITRLRLCPVMFELGARPYPPRMLYRAYLEQSDVFVGIYWERYGWVAPGETISGLEDEYNLARDRPKLIYVKTPAPDQEPRLRELLKRIQGDDSTSYRKFATAAELQGLIENDLALLLTERFADVKRSAPDRRPSGDLPVPRGRLVGRDAEARLVRQLLLQRDVGLVTLTGPGGSGKSRLALHVAAAVRGSFRDGVFFVPLAPLADYRDVVPAIARALGIQTHNAPIVLEGLIDHLRSKRVLLVLDNFEHLLLAAPLVNDLLERCAQTKVLATSRSPLHVRGEREVGVPPLELPVAARMAVRDDVGRYPALELFVERARESWPAFAVTDEMAPFIAEICTRLDGLPLAIELAAAHIKVLPPRALLARLERRLSILSGGARDLPPRHRTLRQAIGWSYDLLEERERLLFRRMAVFVGGFDMAAAEMMCCEVAGGSPDHDPGVPARGGGWDSTEVIDGVGALLDANLLWVGEGQNGEPRFDMFETIREYAIEVLTASGEADEVRHLHAAWALALAERAAPELIGPDQGAWLTRLDSEDANLRAAVEWSLASEDVPERSLRLGAALWRYWWSRGQAPAGLRWLACALTKSGPSAPLSRAGALVAAAELAEGQADYTQAVPWCEEALTIYRAMGDEAGEATALNSLGHVVRAQGGLDRAEALHNQSLGMFRRLDDDRGAAVALNALGVIARLRGDYPRAETHWAESLALVRRLGDHRSVSALLSNLGILARVRDDAARAIALHEEALELARSMGDRQGVAHGLVNLAVALYAQGDQGRAIAAYQEALESCRESGDIASQAVILYDLGGVAEADGDLPLAAARFAESLRMFRQTGSLAGVADDLERIGAIAVDRDAPERATQLFAAATAIRAATGVASEFDEYERHVGDARATLGEAAFDAAWALGSTLTPDQAVAEALELATA